MKKDCKHFSHLFFLEFRCLPIDPSEVELNDTADRYIERVFCGHIYHLGCLRNYMRLPPFPSNGKTCPAKTAHPRSDHKGTLGSL